MGKVVMRGGGTLLRFSEQTCLTEVVFSDLIISSFFQNDIIAFRLGVDRLGRGRPWASAWLNHPAPVGRKLCKHRMIRLFGHKREQKNQFWLG